MRGINLPTLPVRVLDFAPRIGESNQRLTAILDRCPELLDLNLKIGIGMKILDTVPWISREFSQLSATIPDFSETGWFSAKVPLYIISLGNDSGFEVPLQSWCFGQLEYKFSDYPATGFQSFSESDLFSGKPPSLSQEVLQRVNSQHQLPEIEANLFPNQCLPVPKFGLPDYQPRLRMSTYTTQLRKTLENNNYFPDLDSMLMPPQHDDLDLASNLENINSILGSDAQDLKAILEPYTMKSTTSPTPSFSSLTTPPDVSLPDFNKSPKRHRSNTVPSIKNKPPYSPPNPSKVYPKLQPKPSSDPITKPDTQIKPPLKERSSYSLKDQLPYHGVLNRADLVLQTSIDLMIDNWSSEELKAGRRLVKFHRRHEENTLYCQFDTWSPPNDRDASPSSDSPSKELNYPLVISVIYWPHLMPDCNHFITSVDLVHLLEGLLEVLFTLEEKNRIRRNLELFGPITITKGSPTTGALFRQIMQFPCPRPRHIEKGIKVFPYHQLAPMLRKVVGKHTASRSSTLRVNLLPLASLSTSLPPHSS